ncbi:MAG: TonB-dependent receptor [Rhodocyclaceae bacterium]|nr:TonB-dependent receptor [Rhodocyclaceae bacterium]MBX3667496.1 TonB-dependent receptor [Rhodocyclaceae bacterium]
MQALCCLRRRATLCAVAAALSGSAVADDLADLGLETLLDLNVETASRFPQKRSEAPSAVTIITADDIRAYGYRTLGDLLNAVRGLYVFTDRAYDFLGARGFGRPGDYNGRLLLLIDGYRTNEPVYGTAAIGTEAFLDMALIERVEFVPGPGSAVYGNNAFFGVINVITKNGQSFQGAQLAQTAGDHGLLATRATFGRRYENGADLVLSASRYADRGLPIRFPPATVPGLPDATARQSSYTLTDRAFAKFSYGRFGLELGWVTRTIGFANVQTGSAYDDPRTRDIDTQHFLSLTYNPFCGQKLECSLRTDFGAYDYDQYAPYIDPPGSPKIVNHDLSRGRWWSAEAKFVWTGWDRHKLVFGAEYRRDMQADQANFDVEPVADYANSKLKANRFGMYAQDEWSLSERWLLNAGLRYDLASGVEKNEISPRIALIYQPQPGTALKLIAGSAFRAPNAYEANYVYPGQQKANPSLKPEHIRTYEAVWEQAISTHTRFAVTAFQYRITDLINLVTDPNDGLQQFRNSAPVSARGVEGEFERVWDNGLRLKGSLTLQSTRDTTSGGSLTNSPRRLAKLQAQWPLLGHQLGVAGGIFYLGRRTSLGEDVPGYTLANVNMTWRPAPHWNLSLGVYNLLDRRYSDPLSEIYAVTGLTAMPQPGRRLQAQVEIQF